MNMSYLLHFRELLRGSLNPIDDTVDKINRRYSVLLFMTLSIPLMTKQFVGDPIQCFTPTYFTEAQTKYVNSFCWTTSTYYLLEDLPKFGSIHISGHDGFSEVPHEGVGNTSKSENRVRVSYYQWTVTILVFQGLAFYIPFVFWRTFANANGVSLPKLLTQLCCAWDHMAEDPERQSMMKGIVAELRKLLGFRPRISPSTFRDCLAEGYWCLGHRVGLTGVYLTMKVMYAFLPLVQLSVLASLFGKEYITSGFRYISNGFPTLQSKNFPLQTLCQVSAAQQGSLRVYQCQCVLPVNLYNEKIFTFLWFYLVALSLINLASFGTWIYYLSARKLATVASYRRCLEESATLDDNEELPDNDCISQEAFAHFLDFDGILFLRLAEVNSGVLASEDVFRRLWKCLNSLQKAATLVKTTVSTSSDPDELTPMDPSPSDNMASTCFSQHQLSPMENGIEARSLSPGGMSRHRLDMDMAIISAYNRRSPLIGHIPMHWRRRRSDQQYAASRSSSRNRF